MNKVITPFIICLFVLIICTNTNAQLSKERLEDIAEIKVERFQNILDLTAQQSSQLKRETIKMMTEQGSVANSKDLLAQINKNFENYYANLTTLSPQQLNTLKLMDSMDRQNRRESYKDLMTEFGQSSDFAIAVAAYNWNVVMPILVSYRKDLDRYMSPADKATIAEVRSKLIDKYDFIYDIRESNPSKETEAIVSTIEDEIIIDINNSAIPRLLKKYDEQIGEIRLALRKHENRIHKGIESIYEQYMLDNYKDQIKSEQELLHMLGITNLLRNAFFILLDGDSRIESFKINALHLMANGLVVTDQF